MQILLNIFEKNKNTSGKVESLSPSLSTIDVIAIDKFPRSIYEKNIEKNIITAMMNRV